jgi:3-dehydroquinate synthase
MKQLTLRSPAQPHSYEVFIGENLYSSPILKAYIDSFQTQFAIITDTIVGSLYAQPLADQLLSWGKEVQIFSFPAGEHSKTRHTKEQLEDQLLAQGYGRDSCLIALGGGVVTDIAAFLASTYCRGVPLLLLPTSLLAMVDASIGGKTGVNTPFGKNVIGTFYHPKAVLMDLNTLKTLPLHEIKNGVVEMIKHGIIRDPTYVTFLESYCEPLLTLDLSILREAIFTSCQIKQSIVQEEGTDQGKRHLLNLGHTVAHALEACTDYYMPHGRAVAVGILVESYLSLSLGHLALSTFERIHRLIKSYQIDLSLPEGLSPQSLLERMALDKKSLKNQPRFVLVKEVGSVFKNQGEYCTRVEKSILLMTLQWMCDAMCRD